MKTKIEIEELAQAKFKKDWDSAAQDYDLADGTYSNTDVIKKLCKLYSIGDIIKVPISNLNHPDGKVFISPIAKIISKTDSEIKIRILNPYKDLKTIKPNLINPLNVDLIIKEKDLGKIKSDAAILSYIKLNNLDPEVGSSGNIYTATGASN